MIARLGRYAPEDRPTKFQIDRVFRDNLQSFMQDFVSYIEDDFSFPQALAVFFELQSYVNSGIDESLFSDGERRALIDLMKSWDDIFALMDWSLLE